MEIKMQQCWGIIERIIEDFFIEFSQGTVKVF